MRNWIPSSMFATGLALGGVIGALAARSLLRTPGRGMHNPAGWSRWGTNEALLPSEAILPDEGHGYWDVGTEVEDLVPAVTPGPNLVLVGGGPRAMAAEQAGESPTEEGGEAVFPPEGRLFWDEGADMGDLAPGILKEAA